VPGRKQRRARLDWSSDTGWLFASLLPGLLILFLGFRSGGFYVGAVSLAAAEMALVTGFRFAAAKRALQGLSVPLVVAVTAMGLLAGWTLLSANWSDSVARAFAPYSRALLCGLLLFFFGTLPFSHRRIRWMLYGVAAAIVVICGAALIARLLPETIFDSALVGETRLAYPLTYWNALGLISCVGTVLCAHLACSTRDHPIARVLGAAAVPMLVVTLYYTLSRGGIWAAPAALTIYAIVGRPRALLSGVIAVGPATAIALLAANPTSSITDGYPFQMVSEGKHVALVMVGCMGGAALLRACLLPFDNWLKAFRLPSRVREPVIVCSVLAGLALAIGAVAVTHAPDVASTKYHEFTDRENTNPESRGEKRLLSARPEGRFELWDVALDAYREEPLHGTGAGTYVLHWNKDRESGTHVVNAHSLYLETLSELGIVGLILLFVAIAMILGAFVYRARGPDRAMFAALLAAGLAWTVHAGVDWDWQMPAVTIWLFAFGGAALARSLRWKRRRKRNELKTTVIRAGGAIACLLLAVIPARVALSQARLNSAIEAMNNNDCLAARSYANDSLSAVSQRPTPYAVMAYCDLMVGRYGSATIALQRALQRDPNNWELHYSLAVARAGAGLDPRGAAQRAALLNPNEMIAASAPLRFRGQNRRAWEGAAEGAPRLPPKIGDP
jgi:O-antigen ligase